MKRTAGSSSRLMLASALMIGALSTPAWAAQNPVEPEVYFYPAQGWAVQKSDSGMCSIASAFNNGFTLRFDGDQKWVQGMQVNFAQNVFEPGKNYDVSLSVPGVEDANLRATSQGGDTLAMGLRRDKEFYKALRKSAVLDLHVEGNDFRFYLTGFSQSAGEFERCMAGAVMPEDGPERADARYMVNETIAMEEQARAQAGAMVEISPEDPQPVVQEIAVKETHRLGDETIADAGAAAISAASADVSSEAILSTEVSEVGQKDAQIVGRKRLSEQLAAQIAQDPSLIDTGDGAPAPRKALSMPPEMPKALPEPVAEDLMTPPPVEDVANEVMDEAPAQETAEVQPPAESLLEPAEMATVEDVPVIEEAPAPERIQYSTPPMKVNKERYQREADFTEIEPAAAPFDTSTQELRKQVLSLEDMVAGLKNENMALTEELESALQESEDERLSIASENWNLEQATMRFNEAERQIKRMGGQLQKERAKCNAEKRELEAMLFDPQVTDQAQLARLAELESQLIKARKEIERYEDRIRTLERSAAAE